jgi:hypothetical protein
LFYYAFFRSKHFVEMTSFDGGKFQSMLKDHCLDGAPQVRAGILQQLNFAIRKGDLSPNCVKDYFLEVAKGTLSRSVSLHYYDATVELAKRDPATACAVVEAMVRREVVFLQECPQRTNWYPRSFKETMKHVQEFEGNKECASRINAQLSEVNSQVHYL